MGNNNKSDPSNPIMVALFIAFIIIAAIFMNITDSMIVAMSFSFLILAGLAMLVYAIIKFLKKVDKKKLKKHSIIICSSIFVIIIGICVANAFIPSLTQNDVKELVKSQVRSQLDEVKSELNVSDLTVDIYISDYKYEKPTLFSKGYISFTVDDCYNSKSFTELDSGTYNSDTYSKYYYIKLLDYDDIKIDNYNVYIERDSDSYRNFKDSDGDKYTFGYDRIYKNKDFVYTKSSSSYSSSYGSSYSSSSKRTCPSCHGTGRVKYYSGQYDAGTVGTCTMCKGTGKV